jgi:hypothetical protein
VISLKYPPAACCRLRGRASERPLLIAVVAALCGCAAPVVVAIQPDPIGDCLMHATAARDGSQAWADPLYARACPIIYQRVADQRAAQQAAIEAKQRAEVRAAAGL